MQLDTPRAPQLVSKAFSARDFARALCASGALAGALLVGCGSDTECVIDSDCASLAQVCEANKCVPLSAPPVDLGSADLGGDAGVRDASSDGATDGATPDAGPSTTRSGFVYAESSASAGSVGASFSETPPTPPGPCTTRTEGPCSVTLCAAGASTAQVRSAGNITVSGGTSPVTITPNADDTYTPGSVATQLFATGTALTFDATGNTDGGVPAFTGTVTSPSGATLSTPALTDGVPLAITAGTDLAVAWAATGPTGSVDVRFSAATTDGGFVGARCRFPIGSFTGTIPAAAFSDFPAGGTGTYSFYLESETGVTSGSWNVSLSARSPMATSSGAASTGSATF